jgi:tetratricopeptide (TPR) repeat protein
MKSPESNMASVTDWPLAALCAVHALGGDWDQAAEFARQAIQARSDKSLKPFALTSWYETEALLRGGDGDLARAEVERLAGIVGTNKRNELILLRSQAVLAQWDGDSDQAIAYLQAALALSQEIGLPGEAWPILGVLGGLFAERGEEVKARQAYQDAAVIIHRLADTIDDDELREGF